MALSSPPIARSSSQLPDGATRYINTSNERQREDRRQLSAQLHHPMRYLDCSAANTVMQCYPAAPDRYDNNPWFVHGPRTTTTNLADIKELDSIRNIALGVERWTLMSLQLTTKAVHLMSIQDRICLSNIWPFLVTQHLKHRSPSLSDQHKAESDDMPVFTRPVKYSTCT